MFTLIYAEITQNFKRLYKLYLTNILSILVIVLLYAYIDGSLRQLELRNSVFSGEVVVKLKYGINLESIPVIENSLPKALHYIKYISRKVRSNVQFELPGINNTGAGELLGVDFEKDENIKGYLTLMAGEFPTESSDILIPSSLLKNSDIKVGDNITVAGLTSSNIKNIVVFKVTGIYNSPNLSLFNAPTLLINIVSMQKFFQPEVWDWEFCIFFKDGLIPSNINKDIKELLGEHGSNQIERIQSKQTSSFDVLNLSVQFNIFLMLMIILTIIVVVTFVMLVNFNIYMILFRKRQREIGILMSFGVKSWRICLTLFLETIFQLIISAFVAFALAYTISFIGKHSLATGTLETLFVLLSGTNRVDFYIQSEGMVRSVIIILTAVTVSQVPVLFKVLIGTPIKMMRND